MSAWSQSNDQLSKERFWRTPPPDPTGRAARAGVPYYRAGKSRVLMPDDFMPVGPHAGKHLRAVPADYLLWVEAQPWSRHWVQWQPVADFIARFITCDPDTLDTVEIPGVPLFVDQLRPWPTKIRCFKDGSAHLHTLPGWEDYLHTFAMGALALDPRWYQNKLLPHYDLTKRKHALALECGAIEIPDTQMRDHTHLWKQFRQTTPAKLPL